MKILRLPIVKAKVGLGRSTIYAQVSQGVFPKPVSIGPRAIGWVDSEIDEWIAQRIDASRKVCEANGIAWRVSRKRPAVPRDRKLARKDAA